MTIAPVGQAVTQAPQLVHLRGSIEARLSVTVIAPFSQVFSHFLQPMQPFLHNMRVKAVSYTHLGAHET